MEKFSALIGNPPYQSDDVEGNTRSTPIYPAFMDEAYKVAERVELVTPGRFLFNAGQTLASWNEKMLSDPHLKVVKYEPDASEVFSNTDIKGGIAVTYRDETKDFGPIGTFTVHPELNSILKKVEAAAGDAPRLDSIFASQRLYKLSDRFFEDNAGNPNVQRIQGSGTRTKITSGFVEAMPHVFRKDADPDGGDVRFLARIGSSREWRHVRREYLKPNEYLDAYKLMLPEANNSGRYGETLADGVVSLPGEGSADTFLNAGPFETREEAANLERYYRTKFFRALLGVRKATQHCPARVWATIPLQDFTSASDIDWSRPVPLIDEQLYQKYELTEDEVAFIEENVQEMM